jgi:DNA-binding NarL/FixJ family response regulator
LKVVGAMQIFLIEDDAIYSQFIQKALGLNPDYKIQVFGTAEDAFAAIDGKLPDAMIIDYKLPGMSGIELFEKVKDKVKDEHKIIMLSALDDGNMVLSFIQKGVRDYVIKDEHVIESLKAILEGNDDDYLFG